MPPITLMQPLYPEGHPRSVALLAKHQADWVMEADYVGLIEVPGKDGQVVPLVMMEKFTVVRLLAGAPRAAHGPGAWTAVPWEEGRELVAGRRYWLAAKKGRHWRIV